MAETDPSAVVKPERRGIKASEPVAGMGAGVVIAWSWNGMMPDYQMPPEVAAAVTGLLGPVVRWGLAWLPEPRD